MLNIGRDNNDASYRYKMPKLQTKIEGRGNGIKTVIVNMVDVAKHLHVEPAYPTKFFGFELGAQSKFAAKEERAVVNGAHQAGDLQKLLDKYIDTFVLCPKCKLPEIRMAIKADVQKLQIDCAACGYGGLLKTVHKLATYIIKNPPAAGHSKSTESGKEDTVAREADEQQQKQNDAAPKKEKEKVEWFTDTSEEAQKVRREEEFKSMQSNKAAALTAAGTAAAPASAAGAASGADDKEKEKEKPTEKATDKKSAAASAGKLEDAGAVLKGFMESGKRTADEIASELKRLALARGLDDPKRISTLLQCVLKYHDKAAMGTISKQIATAAPVLKKCAASAHDRKTFVNCVEQLVAKTEPKLIAYTPHILQALYEADVLPEETILSWADSPAESAYLVSKDEAAAVRKRAKPFIDWLKTAEEED